MSSKWASRKFWAMMFWQAVVVWMRVRGHLPAEAFVSLTTVLLGGYFAANVVQAVTAKPVPAPAPSPAPAPAAATASASEIVVLS